MRRSQHNPGLSQQRPSSRGNWPNTSEIFKTLLASTSFLLPASFPCREILVEGLYGLSNFIQLLSSSPSPSRTDITALLRLFTNSISSIEVFLELSSSYLLGDEEKDFVILMIETIKACCRLMIVASQNDYVVLEAWGKQEKSMTGLKDYFSHYHQFYQRKLQTMMNSPFRDFDTPFGPTSSPPPQEVFTGRRSGIKLKYPNGLKSAVHWRVTTSSSCSPSNGGGVMSAASPVTSGDSDRSDSSASSEDRDRDRDRDRDYWLDPHHHQNSKYLAATPQYPLQRSVIPDAEVLAHPAPHSPLASTSTLPGGEDQHYSRLITDLSDFNTPYRRPPPPISSSETPSITTDNDSFSELGRVLLLAEVIYIIRPVVYVLVMRHLRETEKKSDQPPITTLASASLWKRLTATVHHHLDARVYALLLSFLLEIASIQMTTYVLQQMRQKAQKLSIETLTNSSHHPSPGDTTTDLSRLLMEGEQRKHALDEEIKRRKLALWLYLLRSPLFDRATAPMLTQFMRVFGKIPLIGSLPSYLLEMLTYLHQIHFHHSNSS